jgi:hypothetical protein
MNTDDDVIVSFENSNVEDTFEIKVIHEVLKDDAQLTLNMQQINNEVVNLLYEKHNANLKNKVNDYIDLLLSDNNDLHAKFNNFHLKPIILCNKLRYVNNIDNDIDNEFENNNYYKTQTLYNYLDQFSKLNRDRSNVPYKVVASKLYALSKPFVDHDDTSIHKFHSRTEHDIECMRHCLLFKDNTCDNKYERFRLIGHKKIPFSPEQTLDLYDGDTVDIIGYYNIVDESNYKKYDVVNFNDYIDHLNNLSDEDDVIVYFNDFLEVNGLKEKINGKVINVVDNVIHIDLDNGKNIKYFINKYNSFFVYKNDSDAVFSKRSLVNKNIAFPLINGHGHGHDLLYSFINPVTVSEILFMFNNKYSSINNLQDISDNILKEFGINTDSLSHNTMQVIKNILNNVNLPSKPLKDSQIPKKKKYVFQNKCELLDFEKNKDALSYYNKYHSFDTFADKDIQRIAFIRKQPDFGMCYILELYNSILSKKYGNENTTFSKQRETVLANLEKLSAKKELFKISCEKKPTIAKTYDTFENLRLDDDNDELYFDEKHDKTMYHLKQKIIQNNPQLSPSKLRYQLIKELSEVHPNMSKDDIEFEAMSIIHGQRRIRQGDHALLEDENTSTIFTRQNVQGKSIWIKVGKVPFKLCTDTFEDFETLIADSTCTLDSFDSICKSAEIVRDTYKYNRAISQLELIDDIIANYSKFKDFNIEKFKFEKFKFEKFKFEKFKSLLTNPPVRSIAFNTFTYKDPTNYKDYSGDLEYEDIDAIFNLDFAEKDHFEKLANDTPAKAIDMISGLPNYDVIQALIDFTQLDLDAAIIEYILNYNNIKNKSPHDDITSKIDEEKKRLYKAVNKTLYDTNPKYKTMFDSKVDEKIQQFVADITRNYYKSSIVTIVSMVILIVMVLYPNKLLGKIIPNCIQYLSYSYEAEEKNSSKSLVKYFACLLRNIGSPGDLKFSIFSEGVTFDSVEKLLKDEINAILKDKYDLKTKLDENAEALKASDNAHHGYDVQDYQKFFMFKPSLTDNYDIPNGKYKKVIEQLKTMSAKVKTEKNLTKNIYGFPTTLNSCCLEKLNPKINYYDFFNGLTLHKSSDVKNVGYAFYPSTKDIEKQIDIFQTLQINVATKEIEDEVKPQESKKIEEYGDSLINSIAKTLDDDEWWSNTFYPELNKKSKYLTDTLPKYITSYSTEFMEYVSKSIIDISNVNNPYDTRTTLYNFLKSYIPTVINRLLNGYKPPKVDEEKAKTDKFLILLETFSKNKKINSYKNKLRDIITKYSRNIDVLLLKCSKNDDLIIKNVSILAYVLLTLFNEIITISTDSEIIRIGCSIIELLVSHLVKKLINNDSNLELLRKSLDELREKRKQQLMDSYSIDDEERELQMLLKKIGVVTWSDTGVAVEDQQPKKKETVVEDITPVKNDQEEEENYNLTGFKAENDDDDDNDDEYGITYE